MLRTQIINMFIEKYGYKSFLEIGVNDGLNFRQINCKDKVGVDPAPAKMGESVTTYKKTSDDFFFTNTRKFDVIFVDGLHHSDAVYRDIINSLEILNDGGVIICHDMSPIDELHQRVPRESVIWNGDCWKAWVQLRQELDKDMFVINTDWGCGVIREGTQTKLQLKEELNFDNLVINRKKWLNLIEVDEFVLNL